MCDICGDDNAVHPSKFNIIQLGGERMLGFIPYFLNEKDPRPAKEQFKDKYAHGGGWQPFSGFKVLNGRRLKYDEDPIVVPAASFQFRKELIVVYPSAWVMIEQADGSYEISRMD